MDTSKHQIQPTPRQLPPLAAGPPPPAMPAAPRHFAQSRVGTHAQWEPHDGWQPIRLRRSIDDLAPQLDTAAIELELEGIDR